MKESGNTAIGKHAGLLATRTRNCTFIGISAGSDIIEGDGIIIIGDYVRSLDRSQKDVLFLGEKTAFGTHVFGKPINLLEVIRDLVVSLNLKNIAGIQLGPLGLNP